MTVEASTITDLFHDWRVPQLSLSSLAIDRGSNPFKGRLYAAWPDARGGHTQIRFASSDDLGRTWTAPQVINDDTGPLPSGDRPNDFMPMVAVNKDGVVAVAWYDRRDNPDNLGYFERLSASLDGGATWLPSIRVSSSANVPEAGNMKLNSGDTAGLAADANGVFHPVWIDNRTGVHQMVDGQRYRSRGRPKGLGRFAATGAVTIEGRQRLPADRLSAVRQAVYDLPVLIQKIEARRDHLHGAARALARARHRRLDIHVRGGGCQTADQRHRPRWRPGALRGAIVRVHLPNPTP